MLTEKQLSEFYEQVPLNSMKYKLIEWITDIIGYFSLYSWTEYSSPLGSNSVDHCWNDILLNALWINFTCLICKSVLLFNKNGCMSNG